MEFMGTVSRGFATPRFSDANNVIMAKRRLWCFQFMNPRFDYVQDETISL